MSIEKPSFDSEPNKVDTSIEKPKLMLKVGPNSRFLIDLPSDAQDDIMALGYRQTKDGFWYQQMPATKLTKKQKALYKEILLAEKEVVRTSSITDTEIEERVKTYLENAKLLGRPDEQTISDLQDMITPDSGNASIESVRSKYYSRWTDEDLAKLLERLEEERNKLGR